MPPCFLRAEEGDSRNMRCGRTEPDGRCGKQKSRKENRKKIKENKGTRGSGEPLSKPKRESEDEMMELKERASYLKGLADGLEYDKTTKEGKLIAALIELVSDMAAKVDELDADMDELTEDTEDLREYVEEIDEDLSGVEDFLDDEGEDDDDEDDGFCDGNCASCQTPCDEEEDDDDEDDSDSEYFEIVCPSCGETICFDESVDPENLTCPACGEKFACIVDEDDLKKLDGEDKED